MVTTQCMWDRCTNTGTERGSVTFPSLSVVEPGPLLTSTIKTLPLVLCDEHFGLPFDIHRLSAAAIESAS